MRCPQNVAPPAPALCLREPADVEGEADSSDGVSHKDVGGLALRKQENVTLKFFLKKCKCKVLHDFTTVLLHVEHYQKRVCGDNSLQFSLNFPPKQQQQQQQLFASPRPPARVHRPSSECPGCSWCTPSGGRARRSTRRRAGWCPGRSLLGSRTCMEKKRTFPT